MSNYVAYHVHTMDSLLDSCTSYKEYIDKAVELDQKAICFTEHGNMYHWYKKYEYCKEKGIKFLYGIECYMTETHEEKIRDNYHVILIAKNHDGFVELNRLVSETTKGNHRYYKPRISFDEFLDISNNIIKISACLASPIFQFPRRIIKEEKEGIDVSARKEKFSRVLKHYDYYEIQYHYGEQIEYNKVLFELSKQNHIPLIAGTDTHSINNYKADCRIMLKYGKTDGDWGDGENSFDLTYKTYDELVNAFKSQDALPESVYLEAIDNTNKMADSCWDFEIDCSVKYPILYDGQDETQIMIDRIMKMYQEKVDAGIIDGNNPEYMNNIKEEIRVFKKINMMGFMLFMSELMSFARSEGLFTSPCRGSVGGSTVAYITDIIDVDPVKMHTIFSRFANEYREEVGDIDVDFYEDDRPKIYKYIFDRFGLNKCAYILTVGTLADKAAIDTIGKAFRIKAEKEGTQTEYTLQKIKEIKSEWDKDQTTTRKKYPDLFWYYDGLVGCTVSQSMHPAGVVVSPINIIDNYGVFYNADDQQILPIDMDEVHEIGLVKYDILGLKNVGVISKTCKYAGVELPRSYKIDWCDQDVFKDMMSSPVGIFQFESDYAFSTIKTFYTNIKNSGLPFTIDDMSIANACIRPSGDSYRDDLIALKTHKNPSKLIDDLLANTHGYLTMQEQVIAFLQQICGLSGGAADNVRRAIGRKQIDRLEAALPEILDGYCSKSDKPREIAEQEAKEFLQVIEDSSSYMFGYNHSTGYSMLGYLCAYYRYYYPIEFCTAFLNCSKTEEDINNGTALAKSMGIKIENPKLGSGGSNWGFDKSTNTIYKGLKSIKNLGKNCGDTIDKIDSKYFNSFVDFFFANRSAEEPVQTSDIKILIKAGYFSRLGSEKKMFRCIDVINAWKGQKWQGRKTIKKAEAEDLGVDIMKYATNITPKGNISEKQFYINDWVGLVKEICNQIDDEEYGAAQIITYQYEALGQCDLTFPDMDWRYVLVTNIDTKYSPRITGYCLQNGKLEDFKIHKRKPYRNKEVKTSWNELQLQDGDIIYIKKCKTEPKRQMVDGEWQDVPGTKEFWLKDYSLVYRDIDLTK